MFLPIHFGLPFHLCLVFGQNSVSISHISHTCCTLCRTVSFCYPDHIWWSTNYKVVFSVFLILPCPVIKVRHSLDDNRNNNNNNNNRLI
jgi:hypothetical protein